MVVQVNGILGEANPYVNLDGFYFNPSNAGFDDGTQGVFAVPLWEPICGRRNLLR